MHKPTAAVVAFSRQQTPSAEILVESDVAGERREGAGPRLNRRWGTRRGEEEEGEEEREGEGEGEEEGEGEVVVVAVSPALAEACGITGHICTTSNSTEPDRADSTQEDT